MMKDKLVELLKKKKSEGAELSDVEKHAKMNVMKDLSDMASSAMGDKLKGLKKVTVASNDKEGLEQGLEKAKEMLGHHGLESEEGSEDEAHEEAQEDPMEEANESPAMEASEEDEEEMSPEEIDAEIARLHEKKKHAERKMM